MELIVVLVLLIVLLAQLERFIALTAMAGPA
jgi:hypothetical protein